MPQQNLIIDKLQAYKKKYYLNLLLRGGILASAFITSAFLIINSLEYTLRFDTPIRTFLFFSFLLLAITTLVIWVVIPTYMLATNNKHLSNEEAAKQIGQYFPKVKDKLLNTLQLQKISQKENTLIQASIDQKSKEIALIPFTQAVKLNENKKYLKYVLIPLLLIAAIIFIKPGFFAESATRIIHYNEEFIPEAPFQFILENKSLKAFSNEDFTIILGFAEGDPIPNTVYLLNQGQRIKMTPNEKRTFEYTFKKIKKNQDFSFEAAGFFSQKHTLNVVSRPNLKYFNISLQYPSYLKHSNENLKNIGNFQIPEGTTVNWQFHTLTTDSLSLTFLNKKDKYNLKSTTKDKFVFKKRIQQSDDYVIQLTNTHSTNKNPIQYHMEVIPDQYPEITLQQFRDTTLFSFMVLGGNIADDYGLTELKLYYRTKINQNSNKKFQSTQIPIQKDQNNQSYYYQWNIDTLDLKESETLEYYLSVWDNDGVNGRKQSKTARYSLNMPSKKQIEEQIASNVQKTQKQIETSSKEAEKLKQKLEEAENRLKSKKELNWQDKKLLEEIVEKRKELEKQIQELKEKNKLNQLQQEKFTKQDKKLQEKAQKLQKLMDELLDEKTKELYQELQKLLQENNDLQEIQDVLQKINQKEINLEKELDRSLELFKKMKAELKLDEIVNKLSENAQKQEELSEKISEKKSDVDEINKQQKEINKTFDEIKKSIDELEKLNQDLENPNPLQNTDEEQKNIQQELDNIQKALEKNQKNKAAKEQKKAAEQMKKMAQKMEQMKQSMEMQSLQENMGSLRNILDNLVKLSFDQEELMNNLKKVRQSDPQFITLSQEQLKLKNDSKIIEDSLNALAKRMFQIESFVTREIGEMNKNMDQSLEALRKRRKSLATSKQQFAMTSINNLALLLDDVLQQMQQQMAQSMGIPQKSKGEGKSPNLSQLQQQLSKQIQELKKSGKSGRQLSESLAKLAAEQEKIRKQLEKLGKKNAGMNGDQNDKAIKELLKQMEENEKDLVNKNITEETIRRQKDITTRLLEAEKSLREREEDEQRKAETAKEQYKNNLPKAFEEYIKAKQNEIELLKTIPLKLTPYYKKEVNEYFKRLNTSD